MVARRQRRIETQAGEDSGYGMEVVEARKESVWRYAKALLCAHRLRVLRCAEKGGDTPVSFRVIPDCLSGAVIFRQPAVTEHFPSKAPAIDRLLETAQHADAVLLLSHV
ncbi:MAG: hypothetical protein ACK55I_42405, partial [bacterium]